MRIANIHEAKTHLSQLLEQVLSGEEVVIAKAGQPLWRIVPWKGQGKKAQKPRRPLGLMKGKIWIADDFDETPPDVIASFYGDD